MLWWARTRGGRGPLHPPGVQEAVSDLHGRVRRHRVGNHICVDALPCLRGRLPEEFLDVPTTLAALVFIVVFALVNVAVLALRKETVDHGHFQTPRVFPVLGLLISAALFAKQVADGDATVFGIFGGLLGVAVLLWVGARYFSGWVRPVPEV